MPAPGVWSRMSLSVRLITVAGGVFLLTLMVMLFFVARLEFQEAQDTLRSQLAEELRTLPAGLADVLVIGDFASLQQNLNQRVKAVNIERIRYTDASGARLESFDTPSQLAAPDWFAAWSGLSELSGEAPAIIGERRYGEFDVILTPENLINGIWGHLLLHLEILLLAMALVSVGIWAVLRRGLKPLHDLAAGSLALAAGDFAFRVPERGSPELRHVGTAFNRMAGEVQFTLNALAESESRVSAILQSIGDGLIATDTTMRITYLNAIAEALTGWTEAEAVGRSITEVLVIENALTGQPAEIPVARVLESGVIVGLANHTVLVARDGSRRHIADSAAPIRDATGRLAGVVMVFRDVTEAYGLRSSLEDSRARLELALKGADLGLWDRNIATGDMVFDQRWAAMLGYRLDEIEQSLLTWENAVHPDDLPAAKQALQNHMDGLTLQYEAEHRLRTKSGDWRWILTRGRVTARDAAGRPLRLTGTHLDIGERKRAEAEIERLAYSDTLTDLPNRRLLLDRLQQALVAARRTGEFGAMLFIDIDHFKHLNDSRGHAAGDQLLRHVAKRLSAQVRAVDTVARIGGDEFVVLLVGLAEQVDSAANQARGLAEKLLASLSRGFFLDDLEHPIGASIGIALFPEDSESADDLLRRADTAMYSAKESGRGRLRFFEPAMQAAVTERMELERDLRQAMERGELRLYLQPQFDAAGSLVGAEALLRWQHPERGLVPPVSFIPLAEETGLIVPIGEWVITTAMRILKQLEDAGRNLRLAVNVSPLQFREADFVARVRTLLQQTGAYAPRLTLEITEGLLMSNVGEAVARMNELESLGVSFSLDDFGTGFSSLSYLKRLQLRELKIDRAFVDGLPRDQDDVALVEAILAIARNFCLTVVAEGVENQAQLEFLKASGCDVFQGYLLGRPVPAETFLRDLGL